MSEGYLPQTGFYRTDKGVFPLIKVITNLDVYGYYYVVCRELTELIIKEPAGQLYCHNNLLSSLIIPEGFHHISCQRNNIKSLTIPLSVESFYCDLMDGIEEQEKKGIKIIIIQKR